MKLKSNSLAVLTAITVKHKDNRVTCGLAVGISLFLSLLQDMYYRTHPRLYFLPKRDTHRDFNNYP